MKRYKLYIREDGRKYITKNDFLEYEKNKDSGWRKCIDLNKILFVGDIALDNNFKYQGSLTESEVFVEFL